MIPELDADGNLPPGVHEGTWEEFEKRFGWTPHRRRLLVGLKMALDSLKAAGCARAFVDGSFVTAKEVPADFDACWDINGVDPSRVDPVLLTFDSGRQAQKIKFRGELFPAQFLADSVSGKIYMEFFQTDKNTGSRKGIIALDLRRLP